MASDGLRIASCLANGRPSSEMSSVVSLAVKWEASWISTMARYLAGKSQNQLQSIIYPNSSGSDQKIYQRPNNDLMAKDIRTDLGGEVFLASAVIFDLREMSLLTDPPEDALDGRLAMSVVGTEPGNVSVRGIRDFTKVSVGRIGLNLGSCSRSIDLLLLPGWAAIERSPFAVNVLGDSDIAEELGLGNTLDSDAQAFGVTINIGIGESVRGTDGVAAGARSSEAVRSRDCGSLYVITSAEPKVVEAAYLRS